MNCAGGDTVSLTEGDSLRKVPKSHRELVTPTVRAAFADPRKHFRGVARRCRFRKLKGRKVNPRETWILGSTECGDMFLFTKNGAGGMLCHENGYVHLIGSIEETIDWIFDELATGRTPQFDYNAWLPKRH